MTSLITTDLVVLDADQGTEPSAVIRALAAMIAEHGRANSADGLADAATAREEKTPTGVPGGIAIPHARTEAVTEPSLAMARLNPPVDFGAKDGPADLVFMIAAPEGTGKDHLKLLSKLARSLVKKDFVASLRAATTEQEVVDLVETALGLRETPEEPTSTEATAPASADRPRRVVAVTACPTGIAHTYMAADALAQAGAEMGIDVVAETQGSSGTTPIDQSVIDAADAVVFAVDVDVRDKARFSGKPYVQVPVKAGIDDPQGLITQALAEADAPNGRRLAAAHAAEDDSSDAQSGSRESIGGQLKRVLLTGVSYMIPFVAAGGLLMALGFLLGGFDIPDYSEDIVLGSSLWNLPTEYGDLALGPVGAYLGAVAFQIGNLSMSFLVAALAGYIAYGIADRPGIAPGFTVGAVAVLMGAGFIGGIIGGLLAGYIAHWIGSFAAPRWLRGLMPVVIIPLVASLVSSGLMFMVLGGPISALTKGLDAWLSSMTGTAAVVLGLILGAMMAVDLGGPVNKVAYSFAVAGLAAGSVDNPVPWEIMATVMAAGMVPPLAMALATAVRPRSFSQAEKENGKAAWLLGAAFISEGAIPFAASDPLRVIPASVVGAGVTGGMTMAFSVTSQAPHGGVFVFFAIDSFLLFLLSVVVGTITSAVLVLTLKIFVGKGGAAGLAEATDPSAATVTAAASTVGSASTDEAKPTEPVSSNADATRV
ncbi:PTS system D-fructose-specific IIA component (F1P-forming), Frc family /PTS system D-fructose-specific IIB component (F1P-forming), Frc family /PTS system D-fructose-specific IIC component (F1P-forming), Frc family [Brevibacterium siliguriense]|uniref:PTS system D-fructose-specific IIA component (F1P-forming), Frc family /PTS system D-fructose-specific IIB component (F1P-forming), Frc family /PTS system D-fructose-specific IIC component (F1P-for... n=1 Tax=Brevibacterium siliguriense TaxID=1136497 RepID=A0A1H1RJC4_9MICO|nr:fructose-specific PTS transporter subunit EIIC [Brevibacterium siliguriense]SDS35800.1 PTS system D-fructose-specific IIA component (F1P-forming), Frc family /PTS system D-fructose-specific IIB component (F1P-forming), Frc family /PTS system D-fructose-specific IIC component (F1P-forming), Frc family [Brevibacterium siliguriense]